jgi:hypothetical protein
MLSTLKFGGKNSVTCYRHGGVCDRPFASKADMYEVIHTTFFLFGVGGNIWIIELLAMPNRRIELNYKQ